MKPDAAKARLAARHEESWHMHCCLGGMAQPAFKKTMDPALLTHEIEALGEQLSRERLDRKAEADHLKLELYAMLSCLKQLVPDFERLFVETYDDVRQKLDPESPQALRSR